MLRRARRRSTNIAGGIRLQVCGTPPCLRLSPRPDASTGNCLGWMYSSRPWKERAVFGSAVLVPRYRVHQRSHSIGPRSLLFTPTQKTAHPVSHCQHWPTLTVSPCSPSHMSYAKPRAAWYQGGPGHRCRKSSGVSRRQGKQRTRRALETVEIFTRDAAWQESPGPRYFAAPRTLQTRGPAVHRRACSEGGTLVPVGTEP